MARTLLAGVPLVYAGDPIQSLSLSAFLDKFLSRKPKVKSLLGGTTALVLYTLRPLDSTVGREMVRRCTQRLSV